MYLLDTNVVSELRKASSGKADARVLTWAASVSTAQLFLSAISILELETGVLLIERKDKKQGRLLRAWLETQVLPAFADRILPADTAVAQRCAKLHVPDRHADRDALLAATALVHNLTMVTRNTRDFGIGGLKTLNPWKVHYS